MLYMPTASPINKNDIQARARLLLQPLDLESLIRKGILEKEGAWYQIINFKEIPEHAWAQVCEMAQDPRGNGSKIKFKKLSKRDRAGLEKVVGTLPKST
jgi:hypothetical protein